MADNKSDIDSNFILPKYEIHEEKNYSHYLWLFIIATIAFGVAAYYFYYLVKKFHQRISKNPDDELKVEQTKNEIYKNLSVFCTVRSISTVIILICANQHNNNFPSFICFICQTFPQLILFSILFNHVSFLIEKYYQIKYRKMDIFLTPSLEILNILVYIVFSLFMLACILKNKFIVFMYLCEGISAFISSIVSILYLYYGISLANVYSIKKTNTELKEKKFIHSKLLSVSLIIGLLFLVKAIISFLICLNVFGELYPQMFNPHLWDFLKLMIFELAVILVLGSALTLINTESLKRQP